MATWTEDIVEALIRLGGLGSLPQIYKMVGEVRGGAQDVVWRAAIRAAIEKHSSDSRAFRGNDLFYSVEGLGNGKWGLRNFGVLTPTPIDNADTFDETQTSPGRIQAVTYRVLRDTALARAVKAMHNSACQLCGLSIELPNGKRYAEAHHLRPLGRPHDGPDIAGNILVLCPNHHVLCDYGLQQINLSEIRRHPDHKVSPEYLTYHNEVIVKSQVR